MRQFSALILGIAWGVGSVGLADPVWAAPQAQTSQTPAPIVRLSLSDAVSDCLNASPTLRQAELDIMRANVALDSARSERLTYSADLAIADGYGANGLFSSGPVTAGQTPTANAQISARVPLFTGHRIERGIDEAQAAVDSSRAQRDQTSQAAIWDVSDAYWAACRAELKYTIATDAVAQATQARDIVRASKVIGRSGDGEVDSAEVALLNQQGDQLRADDDRLVARDRLSALVHCDASKAALDAPPPPDDLPPPGLADAVKLAFARRPDVRLALARSDAAIAERDVATSDRWPQLALEGVYQHGNNPYDPAAQARVVLNQLSGDAYARLDLTYHLFDQGVITRNIKAKQLAADQSDQGIVAVQRTATLEVTEAIERLVGARRRLELGRRSVNLARQNLLYRQNRFRFGYALLTESNQARQNLVVSDNQRADATIDLALARAALARATGTLTAPKAVGP